MANGRPRSSLSTEAYRAETRTALPLNKSIVFDGQAPLLPTHEFITIQASSRDTNNSDRSSNALHFEPDIYQTETYISDHEIQSQEDSAHTMSGYTAEDSQKTVHSKLSPANAPVLATPQSSPTIPSPVQKPPRQDSAYFSIGGTPDGDEDSEVEIDVKIRQVRARERVVICRERVVRTRRIKKERRSELRQLRDDVRLALDLLTRRITEFVALGKPPDDIAPYYEKLRQAQDKLGPVEDEYENLEIRLEEEEENLEIEEDYFYRHNKVLDLIVPEAKIESPLSPLVKPYEPPELESQNDTVENHLVQLYLGKKKEAENLKQQLDHLEDDYFRLAEDSKFRKSHGIGLDQNAESFLSEYSNLHREALEELHDVEDVLFDLRDDCLDQNLFSEDDYIYELRDALYEDIMDFVDEMEERSAVRVAANNVNYLEPLPDDAVVSKQEYINNWLLGWLQDSTIGVMMLKAHINSACGSLPQREEILGDEKWSALALEHWRTDKAGEKADLYFNRSKVDAIAGRTGNLEGSTTDSSGHFDDWSSLGAALDRLQIQDMKSESATPKAQSYSTGLDLETTPTKRLQHGHSIPPVIKTPDNLQITYRSVVTPPAIPKSKSLQPSPKGPDRGSVKRLSVDFSSLITCLPSSPSGSPHQVSRRVSLSNL